MAWHSRNLRRHARVDSKLLSTSCYQSARANKGILRDGDAVVQCRVDANETVLLNIHMTRDHCMRGDKAVICNTAVVTDMVSTPHDDVVPYLGEGLDDVVLKNEAVFSDRRSIVCSLWTYVRNTMVTFGFYLLIHTLADTVHLG